MQKFIFLLLLVFSASSIVYAQNQKICAAETIHIQKMEKDPEYKLLFLERQRKLNEYMRKELNTSKRSVPTEVIPVVFHVIHLGEPLGTGSNVPDAEILAALDQLNTDFGNVSGDGVGMGIQFCLAERDPEGNATTGINRNDGSAISNYSSIGIMNGGSNEVAVKALSIWPNSDYVNIWIVHNIFGNAIGYANFPGSAANVDGVVLDDLVLDNPNYAHVITHELGHFFDLYHTFHASSANTCPPNIDCSVDGDMCCDTRPHYTVFPSNFCDENEFLNCDASSYTFNVHQNYMNYIDNSCMSLFTNNQVSRAIAALNTVREPLLHSLGCEPPCPNLNVSFVPSDNSVDAPVMIDFTNNSTGGITSTWSINGVNFATTENASFTFNDPGNFTVCLTEQDSDGCIDNHCQVMQIFGQPCTEGLEPCNLIQNGNLEQMLIPLGTNCHALSPDGVFCDDLVCNWQYYQGTPTIRYCSNNGEDNTISFASWNEGIISSNPINLIDGQNYTLTFEYLHRTNFELPVNYSSNTRIGLNVPGGGTLTEQVLGNITNPPINLTQSSYLSCSYANEIFESYSLNFTYSATMNSHLFIQFAQTSGFTEDSYFSVKNIRISDCSQCTPIVDIEMEGNCPSEFTATNSGDGDSYVWDFCDGSSLSGQTVSPSLPPGNCEVCVTVYCDSDQENGTTFCEEFTIETCPNLICEIIEDFGVNNTLENSGRDIKKIGQGYSFVGNMLEQEKAHDHYIVSRDMNNEVITHSRIGDGEEIQSAIERSIAIDRWGTKRYVTGYTYRSGHGKDIFVAKLDEENQVIWCKIYDYGGWDQSGTGLKVLGQNFGPEFRKVYVTGTTKTANGTTDMFLLTLHDDGFDEDPGTVYDFKLYGLDETNDQSNAIIKADESLILVGQHATNATALKLDFFGNIVDQFSLVQQRNKYNSVAINNDTNIAVAVGRSTNFILVTAFDVNDMSIIFNRVIHSTNYNKTEEARDVIYRNPYYHLVGRSGVSLENSIQDDGFFISFDIVENQPILINQQLTDLDFQYSESFHAIEKVQGTNFIMIGDIKLDEEFNDIFFVRTNIDGENCCMKEHNFLVKYQNPFVFKRCEMRTQDIKTYTYGGVEESYSPKELCEGIYGFTEQSETELRSMESTQALRVVPNPSTGFFSLDLENRSTIKTIQIMDLSGRKLINRSGTDQNYDFDMSNFESGMFVIQCILYDGSIVSSKFIITR